MKLHGKILIGLLLGGCYGFWLTDYVIYVSWMGELFLRALKMVIVPLILTSIASGVANIGSADNLGKLGFKTITYYLTTSFLAIFTGLFFVNIIQPGIGADTGFKQNIEGLGAAKESFGSTLINIIPENVFLAMQNGEMLSIIFFSLLVGYFIIKLKPNHKEFLSTGINAGFELMMKITNFIIQFTPYGVFGILAVQVAKEAGDVSALLAKIERLGYYTITVIGALAFHFFISLPLLLKFVGKVNPLKHFKAMQTPILTAFSTSSSSATLPLTLDYIERKSGVSNKISSFVLPLGATINMDGTALYECIAVMFIAQALGYDLTFVDQILIVITALLASIGAAGIPMAGLVMMSVVMSAVGLPLEAIGLIIAVDRVLDMFRTATNVWSDSCGAVVIAKLEGEKVYTD